MSLYNGDNNYNGKPLFRAGIMTSGSIMSVDPVDGPGAQAIFDIVAESAGCSAVSDDEVMDCLRAVDYDSLQRASNSVPVFLSDKAITLSYLPRPDGKVITESTHKLAKAGKFAKIPVIIGDLEDEVGCSRLMIIE